MNSVSAVLTSLLAVASTTLLILLGGLVLGPAPATACTISCAGSSTLDCTPCCGSTSCVCSDINQCSAGSFSGVWANTRLCNRTGIKFENSTSSDSTIEMCFSGAFCDPVCISPGVFTCVEITVPAHSTVSKFVDEYFSLNRHSGSVSYEVLSGGNVSTLRSDTSDCTHFTIDQANTCT